MSELKEMSLAELLNVTAVSAARRPQRHIESPRTMSVLTAEDLRRHNYRTVPEALNELAGIMVQETNYAGGAPIIRGMVGNRVLILVDDVRLNNAAYRLGPNQYLNTIDIQQVERIEVIRGPGSVLYGSDALGGLINVITRSPPSAESGSEVRPRLFSRFSTADRGVSTRLEFAGRAGKLGLVGGLSGKRFGDLRAGRGTLRQLFTGYWEMDGDVKLSYQRSAAEDLTVAFQRVHQAGADRTDVLLAGTDLKYEFDPQQRDLLYGRYRRQQVSSFIDSLQAEFSFQNPSEDLARISAAQPHLESRYHDAVRSRSLAVQLGSLAGSRQVFTYGAEYYGDRVSSSRIDVGLLTGQRSAGPGMNADGAGCRTLAAFLQDEIQVAAPLAFSLGLRFTQVTLDATVRDPQTGAMPVDSGVHNLSASAYGSYRLRNNLHAVFGVAQGFRAPNVNDQTVLGGGGNRFEVPNPNLNPEKSLSYEAGVKRQGRRLSGTASVFLSTYRELIERGPGLFRGLPFLDSNGNGLRDQGELPVYQRQNIGRARVEGLAIEAELLLRPSWTMFGNVSWTRGEDTLGRAPLSRIPPVKGILGCRWTPRKELWVEAYSLGAARQGRLSPGDLADVRIRPGGTPGFLTLNLRGGVELGSFGTLTLGLENLTDKAYRWHGSGIDAPGFGAVLGFSRAF